MRYRLEYTNKRQKSEPTPSGQFDNLNQVYKYLQDCCDTKNWNWEIILEKATK